ncbi:MAG: hypothetical protein EBV36_03200, partial [Burkholderiaceae bacterium]|nr:hypothetical protein [Burkholderiaceae bacterium]
MSQTSAIDINKILRLLPHRYPFLLVDRVLEIEPGKTIKALKNVTMNDLGKDNRIGHFAAIGGEPQDMKYRGEPTQLIIGDRNTIREFTTIHTGTSQDKGITSIGNDNWIMAYVHIAHDCQIGNHTIFSSNAQIAGHVEVGDWAIM